MKEPENEDEKFSDDPEEQLKIENEILKLKLNAELGGKFEALSEIPADVENLFLKHVLAFEHEHSHSTKMTVYEVLDKPDFKPSAELKDSQIKAELNYLEALLKEKAIMVDYLAEYTERVKYEFLTEELFGHESSMFSMPGMTTHYIYEEFHPNHQHDIQQRSEKFFADWFEQNFDENSTEMASKFVLPGGSTLLYTEVLGKIKCMLDSFISIEDTSVAIDEIRFDLENNEAGKGSCTGTAAYTAVLENNEEVRYEGAFYLQLIYEHNYWQIEYFTWPGFQW